MRVLSIIISVVLVSLFISCDRDEEIQGPVYRTSGESVKIVDDKFQAFKDTSKVELADVLYFYNEDDITQRDTVFFYAELSEASTWEITIKGIQSGAEKKLVGTSKIIDFPYWVGESDNIYFFRKDEVVQATLSLIGSSVSKSIDMSVEETRLFPNVLLIADFEKGEAGKGVVRGAAAPGDPDGWFQYFDVAGDNEEISYGLGPNEIVVAQPSKVSSPVQSIQGNSYFHLRGDDNSVKPSPFFIGGMGHTPVSYGLKDSIPMDDIFINLYLNSNGNKTTKFIIELAGINGDLFTKEMLIDWEDWRLISVRLSDFVLSTAGKTGIGNIIPSQLKQMKFAIHSGGTAGNIAEVNIDYVTFTFGSPFKQK